MYNRFVEKRWVAQIINLNLEVMFDFVDAVPMNAGNIHSLRPIALLLTLIFFINFYHADHASLIHFSH